LTRLVFSTPLILTAAHTETFSDPATAPQVLSTTRLDDTVTVQLQVPHDLRWFEGHFPEVALLPGVVQTTWVVEFARRYFKLPPQFRSMSNMKFMRFIMPGTRLSLHLRYVEAKRELSFEYREGDAVCASGRMGFE